MRRWPKCARLFGARRRNRPDAADRLERAALNDLNSIAAFIARHDVGAAVRMVDLVEGSVAPAATHPYMFRVGRVPGTREIVAHPNYIVVYPVLANMIVVTAVVHARRQYP